MPRQPKAAPVVPGEQSAEVESTSAAPADAFQAEGFQTADPDELTPRELALQSQVAAMQEQLAAMAAAVSNLSRTQASAARPATEAELPDAEDIDQSTLTSPVLSKQGWVVPWNYGHNPNAPRF